MMQRSIASDDGYAVETVAGARGEVGKMSGIAAFRDFDSRSSGSEVRGDALQHSQAATATRFRIAEEFDAHEGEFSFACEAVAGHALFVA
jgi:hypothetical protein